MARFTKAELESFRDAEVPDLLPDRGQPLRLLFVGINPGLWTAAVQTHFAYPGNKFYPSLLLGGVIDRAIDPSSGMSDEDRDYFRARGLGITNVVRRATAQASELSKEEYVEGGRALVSTIERTRAAVVCIAGIGAYKDAFGSRGATLGLQPTRLGDAELWLTPNPSGLNTHYPKEKLAVMYAEAARAAGVI